VRVDARVAAWGLAFADGAADAAAVGRNTHMKRSAPEGALRAFRVGDRTPSRPA
jgi:hypothetical protein